MAGFHDNRQVWRRRAIIGGACRIVVCIGRTELVCRRCRTEIIIADIVRGRALYLDVSGQRLHERVLVCVRVFRIEERATRLAEIAIAHQFHRVTGRADLTVHLVAALDGWHVELAKNAFEGPALLRRMRMGGGAAFSMCDGCEAEAGKTGGENAERFHGFTSRLPIRPERRLLKTPCGA